MVPHLANMKGKRKEIGLIVEQAGLTLGVLVNVGWIMRRLILRAVLRGRLVGVALLIRIMGHIRTKALEEVRAMREKEREL